MHLHRSSHAGTLACCRVEVPSLTRSMPCRRDDLLQQAFAQFDDDSDGFITEDKLARVTTSRGFHVDAADIKRMIAENDSNGDGRVDYEEVGM